MRLKNDSKIIKTFDFININLHRFIYFKVLLLFLRPKYPIFFIKLFLIYEQYFLHLHQDILG